MASPLQYNYSAAQPLHLGAGLGPRDPGPRGRPQGSHRGRRDARLQKPVPAAKDPLDSGFIELPRRLLDGGDNKLLDRMLDSAKRLRDQIDILVSLGIGGSYMGLRAIFEALLPSLSQ